MLARRLSAALLTALAVVTVSVPLAARAGRDGKDEAAIREMLEGRDGRREFWNSTPALVVISSVMEYTGNDLASGYRAVDETLSKAEIAQLTADMTQALDTLTAGTIHAFRSVSVESPAAGTVVKVIRPGDIVVGRFRGVQAKTGNLGYGGRMMRQGTITGAAVLLDAQFDRQSDRRDLLRTHELGHALGYNHVESRPSLMNPHLGSTLTDNDRAAIRSAFGQS